MLPSLLFLTSGLGNWGGLFGNAVLMVVGGGSVLTEIDQNGRKC